MGYSSNMKKREETLAASIPMKRVGPVKIVGSELMGSYPVPLATFETPLWPSVARGARVTALAGGINTVVMDDRMTRSVLLEAPNAETALIVVGCFREHRGMLADIIAKTSRFARLADVHTQVVGNLVYIRFEIETGDAAGHNMATRAAEALMGCLQERYPDLKYISISGNYCCDKKASAVNGILGRGKYVVAEARIPREICARHLRTTPEKMAEINVKKNLIGSILAGGVRTANAHYANMLLAFYLATGQDAANIVEGSQGITHAEAQADHLYFSCTLPNLILGTVGNGKDLDFVRENLALMDCAQAREPGRNARRLAMICAATVLCGELSLLAAQTNPGELMRTHLKMERK